MHFQVGQSVVHPAHGAGEIVEIETLERKEGQTLYYVIQFVRNRLTMHVPSNRVSEIGMRKVMNRDRFRRVLDTLSDIPGQLPRNFKKRRQMLDEMLSSGLPVKVAEAVRDLTWRRREKHLTKSDSEMLSRGRDLLVTEIALAGEKEVGEAERIVNEAIAEAMEATEATALPEAA